MAGNADLEWQIYQKEIQQNSGRRYGMVGWLTNQPINNSQQSERRNKKHQTTVETGDPSKIHRKENHPIGKPNKTLTEENIPKGNPTISQQKENELTKRGKSNKIPTERELIDQRRKFKHDTNRKRMKQPKSNPTRS